MTKVTIAKRGESSATRLTEAVMEELGAIDGQEIDVSVRKTEPVLELAKPKKITLDWIVSEMQRLGPENEPEMVDWGPDVGDEIINHDYSIGR